MSSSVSSMMRLFDNDACSVASRKRYEAQTTRLLEYIQQPQAIPQVYLNPEIPYLQSRKLRHHFQNAYFNESQRNWTYEDADTVIDLISSWIINLRDESHSSLFNQYLAVIVRIRHRKYRGVNAAGDMLFALSKLAGALIKTTTNTFRIFRHILKLLPHEEMVRNSDSHFSFPGHYRGLEFDMLEEAPRLIPASRRVIKALPRHLSSEGRICVMCNLEIEQYMEVIHFPCGHTFHPRCAEMWLERDFRCPRCRQEVSVMPRSMFNEKPKSAGSSNADDCASEYSLAEFSIYHVAFERQPAGLPKEDELELVAGSKCCLDPDLVLNLPNSELEGKSGPEQTHKVEPVEGLELHIDSSTLYPSAPTPLHIGIVLPAPSQRRDTGSDPISLSSKSRSPRRIWQRCISRVVNSSARLYQSFVKPSNPRP